MSRACWVGWRVEVGEVGAEGVVELAGDVAFEAAFSVYLSASAFVICAILTRVLDEQPGPVLIDADKQPSVMRRKTP
jgi:hypothetical protein